MSELNEMSCEEFAEVAAELALGVLTGRERAAALEHLDRCDTCRENVRQLTLTGEELLGLLPAIEPPAGFEIRVLDRLGMAPPAPAPAPSGRPRASAWYARFGFTRRMLSTAAVVLAVLAAGLGGWGLSTALSPPSQAEFTSAALLSADRETVGNVFLYDDNGSPRWVYMSLYMESMESSDVTVNCQLIGGDGHIIHIGKLRITDGYGAWGSSDSISSGPLSGARLVSANGTILASASFTHPAG